jgi:hypothetical protein
MNIIINVIVVISTILTGCTVVQARFHYRVVVANHSEAAMHSASVIDSSGRYDYGVGFVAPLSYKANAGPMETAPNDEFILRWLDASQKVHEQRVDLRSRIRNNFKGELVFIYGPDGKVSVESNEHQGRYRISPNPQ